MANIRVAGRLNLFTEYIFSKLNKKIAEVEEKSKRKVLNFGPGNPDVIPSPIYLDKFNEFAREKDAHLYPGYGANNAFSQGIISWYKKRFKVSLENNELLPLSGAKDGVSHLPLALLDAGDQVLVPDPGYPAFSDPALMIGGHVVYYDLRLENDFKISAKELEKKISVKTKFIWVNFPSNPTGQVATLEELEKIVAFAKTHNTLIAYDNAYSEITFEGFTAPSILQINKAKDVCVEIGSFSKTFSFAGFRMGWIVGNSGIIKALAKVKSQMDSGLSTPLQNLGAYALTNTDRKWYQQMLKSYQDRRVIIARYLKKLGLKFNLPKAGLYIWAKIPASAKSSERYCMKLLEEKQVLLTPGTVFGKNGERFVRVSICADIENIKGYF